MTLTVIVDDADPAIQYLGETTILDPRTLGPDYNGTNLAIGGTLHNMSQANASAFTYNFTGAGTISMFALMTPDAVKQASVSTPWTCAVNNENMTHIQLQHFPISTTQKICSVVVSNSTKNTFSFENTMLPAEIMFDHLEYTPITSSTPQTYNFIAASFDDSSITYQGSWYVEVLSPQDINTDTFHTGASMEYTFNGTSITLVTNSNLVANTPANVSIAIDNGPPTVLSLRSVSDAGATVPNNILFQNLSLGPTTPHSLNVTYQITDCPSTGCVGTPFMVQSLVVGNGTIPASTPSSGTTSPTSSTTITATSLNTALPPLLSGSRKRNTLVPVTSCAIVGILFVICITGALVWRRKLRKQRVQHAFGAANIIEPFTTHSHPMLHWLLGRPNPVRSEIKALRQVYRRTDALVIPPIKLARTNGIGTEAFNEAAEQESSSREDGGEAFVEAVADAGIGPAPIHAVDSGRRHVEEDQASAISLLPPVYTPG